MNKSAMGTSAPLAMGAWETGKPFSGNKIFWIHIIILACFGETPPAFGFML